MLSACHVTLRLAGHALLVRLTVLSMLNDEETLSA